MTNKQRSLLAAGVFVVVVVVLAFPYLQARLKPIEAIPASGTSIENGGGVIEEARLPNTLVIPALGIEAPVIYVTETTETVYQEALRDGVVHFPGTALPGQPGNTYIFGHSSDYVWSAGDYKTVFAKLPQIELGTEIELTDADGELFRYVVTETKVVGPRDLSVLDQFNNEKRILTLQTSYPLGTALQRYIVVAEIKLD
jgi:LPXTG-site transpeptidase (sortase) family protein